ncbi:MinD/ParA family protein [Oceanobacillus manasiensis]|uniref:MinD/ParA family protein n=1 Tax=Oceanobacillus manasiensis TaxID=586413 RepID=UPI0005A643B8|nr:MinD/ParA family protein [Oceanobacillus manasiensis]
MLEDQAANLRERLKQQKSPPQKIKEAKTVSIISGKGGVGKSNVALNLSLELISQNKRVLLFDLDIGMGNIDILMGMPAQKSIVNLLHNYEAIEDIIETGPLGLGYIAGGSGLNELFSLDTNSRDYFFEQYYKLVSSYDYIIFDMGAGATKDTMSFILASDECIVVTTPEPTSITDAYGMIKHIVTNNPDMPLKVIMNRAPSVKEGKRALQRFRDVVIRFLQIEIDALGILPDDKHVTQAVIRQIPYTLYNENAPVSKAMKQLAYHYADDMPQDFQQSGRKNFLQKLKQLMTER